MKYRRVWKKIRSLKLSKNRLLRFFWKKKWYKSNISYNSKIAKIYSIKQRLQTNYNKDFSIRKRIRKISNHSFFYKWRYFKFFKKINFNFFFLTSDKNKNLFIENKLKKKKRFPWVTRQMLKLIFRERDFFWKIRRKKRKIRKLKKWVAFETQTYKISNFLKKTLKQKKYRKKLIQRMLWKKNKNKRVNYVSMNLIKSYPSNNFELVFSNFLFKKYCYQRINRKVSQASLKFFSIYFIGFFELFFKKKTYVAVHSNVAFELYLNWFIKFLIYKYNYVRKKISANFFLKEMIPALFYSLKFKDLSYFNSWLKTNMEKFPLKKHKKFILFLRMFFTLYFSFFKKTFGIKGFFLDLRGKVSVTGNAKKRHVFISIGSLNKSNRILKFDVKRNLINTNTGVMGLIIILAY